MPDFEIITGPKILDLLQDLIERKALLKIQLQGTGFQGLTVILAIRTEKSDAACIQIDPHEGIWPLLRKCPHPILCFEFLSRDRLPHRFEVPCDAIDVEGWIPLPKEIRRYQLRNNFRLNIPGHAYATAVINQSEFKMAINNLSIGGFYCHCPNSAKALLFKDQIIENLSIVFAFAGEYRVLSIRRAVVRRIEGRTHQRHFGVAFEFSLMDAETEKRLVQMVYALQREYLKNRSKSK